MVIFSGDAHTLITPSNFLFNIIRSFFFLSNGEHLGKDNRLQEKKLLVCRADTSIGFRPFDQTLEKNLDDRQKSVHQCESSFPQVEHS